MFSQFITDDFFDNKDGLGNLLGGVACAGWQRYGTAADADRANGAGTAPEPGDRYLVAVDAAANEEAMNRLRG